MSLLRHHASYCDQDKDGIVYPWDTYRAMRGIMQAQNFGAIAGTVMNQSEASGSTTGGTPMVQPKQRVRARRDQAIDPHSMSEKLRRERIAERGVDFFPMLCIFSMGCWHSKLCVPNLDIPYGYKYDIWSLGTTPWK